MADMWKILRILTTNKCNYRCLYCHNEGQEKEDCAETLAYDDFLRIMNIIKGMGFQEIRFSGGEPLVNPRTIEMIEWLDKNSDYEIGLATNSSLITEDIARRLGNTRVLVTIHYPAVLNSEYERVTGKDNIAFLNAVKLLDKYKVKHSFNFVLYPETVKNIHDVVADVIDAGKRIKLLPFIEEGFNNYSMDIIKEVSDELDVTAIIKDHDEKAGIVSWTFQNGGKVKLLDSPCYKHDINTCREYGELRLLPDLTLQKCIFDEKTVSIKDLTDSEIKEMIVNLWKSFNKCL